MAFDPTFNLGNITTLGTIVVVVAGAYYGLRSGIDKIDAKVDSTVERFDMQIQTLKDDVQVRHIENQRSFDGVTSALREARTASSELAQGIGGLVTRVAVVETKIKMSEER